MLKSQTLAIELSETRQRVNELLETDDLTTELRAELDTQDRNGCGTIEPEIQGGFDCRGCHRVSALTIRQRSEN